MWNKGYPKDNGPYLTTVKMRVGKNTVRYVKILYFADNLEKIDEFDFEGKARPGWFSYDSGHGHCEWDNVIGWMELPKPMKEE